LLNKNLKRKKSKISDVKIVHDYPPLFINKNSIKEIARIIKNKVGYLRFKDLGAYGEAQMINEKYGTKIFYFGPVLSNKPII